MTYRGDDLTKILLYTILILLALGRHYLPPCARKLCGPLCTTGRPHTPATNNSYQAGTLTGSTGDSKRSWTWGRYVLQSKENLGAVLFVNDEIGWIVGRKGGLYKTNSNGRIWNKADLKLPSGADITSLFFADANTGWLAYRTSQAQTYNYGHKLNSSVVAHTLDGGEHWTHHHLDGSAVIKRIFFINRQEGWLIGEKIGKGKPAHITPLLMHTIDAGHKWLDVSESLTRLLDSESWPTSLIDITFSRSLDLLLLSSRGYLLRKAQGSSGWGLVLTIKSESPFERETLSRLHNTSENQTILIGGQDSKEGIFSTVIKITNDSVSASHRVNNVKLFDFISVSGEEVLACGTSTSEGTHPQEHVRDGLVLYSTDGGGSWSVLFRDAQDLSDRPMNALVASPKSINAITLTGSGHAWAVGNNGLILSLSRATARPTG
jgi:photosystem II stability/assembly factor-like uncharacterized protein